MEALQTQTVETFDQFMVAIHELRKLQEETARRMQETDRRMQETDRQMRETFQQMRESQAETNRQIKENQAETNRQMRENQAETNRQIKENEQEINKKFGKLTNRFGDIVESMVIPNLLAKFKELHFTFTKSNPTKINDEEHDIALEVDNLLENGDKVMAVEIKSKPNNDDVDDHIERMEKLRRYADLHNDKRVYLGAIAGVVFDDGVKKYALRKGFYVIEPAGETLTIIEPKGAYHPHTW